MKVWIHMHKALTDRQNDKKAPVNTLACVTLLKTHTHAVTPVTAKGERVWK